MSGVPAPLKYAQKLGKHILDLGIKKNEILISHEHYDKSILGLHFL
jgi:hypothetical protein